MPTDAPIPLQPDTSSVGIKDFYTPTEQELATRTAAEMQFFSERNAYLWTVPSDSPHASYGEALPIVEDNLKVSDRPMAHAMYADSAVRANQQVTSNFVDSAQATDTPEGLDFVSARYRRLEQERLAAESNPEAAVSVASVQALSEYTDFNAVSVNAAILTDMITGSISKQMEESSLPKKVLDFGVAALVGPRALAGQMQFAESVNPNEYFNLLKVWRTKTSEEKAALWPSINEKLIEASGNNSFVYLGIATPFQDEKDDIWARLDQGVGLGSLVMGLFAATRIARVMKNTQKMIKFRELALRAGNPEAAGRATVAAIARGDINAAEAVVEAHPINIPDGDVHFPELVQGVSVPTQRVMMEDLANEIKLSGLTDEEKAARMALETSRLAKGGRVVSVTPNSAGFEVILNKPVTNLVDYSTVTKSKAALTKEIKQLKADLRTELADATPGRPTDKIEALTSQIRFLKLQEQELKTKIAGMKSYTGTTKGVKIKMPGEVDEKISFNWTVDDKTGVLKFEENGPNTFQYMLASKESTLDNIGEEVKTSFGTIADMQQRKVFSDYMRQIDQVKRWLRKPIVGQLFSKKSQGRVEAVLLRGDNTQRIFSEPELLSGIKTDNGIINLTEKEIEAYYGARLVFDNLWVGMNTLQREQLTFAGFSAFDATYVDKAGKEVRTTIFAKASQGDIGYKIPEVGTGQARWVLDATTGKPVDLRSLTTLADDLAKNRKGFVKLRSPYHTSDGSQFRHMLVDVEQVGGLKRTKQAKAIPHHVLPYRRGYVPKIATDPVHHVVEVMDDLVVNGIRVREKRAVAGFQSAREARIFINRKNAAYMAKASADPAKSPAATMKATPVDVSYRRENAETLDLINNSLFKGTFGGHRTDGVFRIGLEEKEAARMGAFESMQRYSDYVGRHVPMHQFREGMIRSFLNSSKGMLEVEGDWASNIVAKSDPRYKAAKSMQDWMRSTFAIPTNEEQFFERLTQMLAQSMDSVIYKNDMGELSTGGAFLKRRQQGLIASKWANDPIQAAKGFAFDMYLGMFNPIQLLVQTAGIAIPMSLHPIEGAVALPKFLALRTLFRMDPSDAAVAAKAMGLNGAEFKSIVKAFNKSGTPDSILAHSDFGHFASSKFGYYSPSMWEEIKKSGRIFYNMGELNNRTFAWMLAYERMAKANSWVRSAERTNQEINMVTQEALRIGMNLTQANRSKLQTNGITALMTQFWKVTMQFYENALSGLWGAKKGGAWTRRESAAALFNSTIALGAANFSIDELMPQYEGWIMDTFALDMNDPVHKDIMTTMRGGVLELMTGKAFDYDIDISDRIGVASGINMMYENVFKIVTSLGTSDDGGLLKALLGASYGIKTRLHTAFADTIDVFGVAGKYGVVNEAQAEAIIKSWVRVTSTGNNALNAMLWRNANNIVIASTGERLGELPDRAAWIGKALGVDPLVIDKYYVVDRQSRAYDKLKTDISKEVASLARELYMSGGITDPMERELLRQRMHFLTDDLTEADKEQVMGGALRVLDEDPKTEKLLVKMIDKLMEARTPEEDTEARRALDILKGTQ